MKKLSIFLSILLFSGFVLTGCAIMRNIQGRPITSSNVGKIINGTTTESQIVSIFGPPHSTEKNPLMPGIVTYKYRFKYKKFLHLGDEVFTASKRTYKEKLDVVMKNGIVISHSFTTTGNISLRKILKNKKTVN